MKRFWLVFILIALQACATSSSNRRTSPNAAADPSLAIPQESSGPTTAADAAAFKDIRDQFGKALFDSAYTASERFLRKFPQSSFTAQVLNIQGLILLDRKQSTAAVLKLKNAVAIIPLEERLRDYAGYNLASAHFQAGQLTEVEAALTQIRVSQLDHHTRLKFYYLKALVHSKFNQHRETIQTILSVGPSFAEPIPAKTLESFQHLLQTSLDGLQDMAALEVLYQEHRDSAFADMVLYRMGVSAKNNGNKAQAETCFRTLIAQFPESPHFLEATDFLKALQNQGIVEGRSVGVLLPMTGKFAKFGTQSLQAISMAFHIFENQKRGDSQVELVVEDAGETPKQAIDAINKLYFEHHVVAVIGPMLGKGSEPVFQRAQELGLPTLSLTQKGVSPGNYVFQTSITPKMQSYEIAKFAIQEKGLKRFAIAYPNDSFGMEYMTSFWDAVESLGGEIAGVETYTAKQTDFKQIVDKLSGLYYEDARSREVSELEKLRREQKITKRTSRTEQYFRLAPIVDYDAVFIPDEAKTVAQILPTFAYRDVDDVQFLGISTWNSPLLVQRAGESADRALFVDMFFADDPSPAVKKFVNAFEASYGRKPSALDAQAYDTAALLEHAILSVPGSLQRDAIRDQLLATKAFPGLTGKISLEEGRLNRSLKVLAVSKNTLKQIN